MFMPESLGDAAAKDAFATTARLICIAQLPPTQIPDAPMRDLAKAMLKVKGVGRAIPHLPRARR